MSNPLSPTTPAPRRKMGPVKAVLAMLGVNAAVFLTLLVPVELIFGTWVRPMGLSDIRRFSVPVGARFDFDASSLYDGPAGTLTHYTRDEWGLRGTHQTLADIDVVTIGGSTTEQRYLDDTKTWQTVAQDELRRAGRPLVIANAGVDGQSTVGHLFDFDFWFPLLPEMRPRIFVFYVGANDVMRRDDRAAFDAALDAQDWRVRSATFQLIRTVRNNLRARSVGVYHGRMRPLTADDFTETGRLTDEQREAIANRMIAGFLQNVERLRQHVADRGALPVFMTQTAYAWTGDWAAPARGVKDTVAIYGVTANYADVAYLHRQLNHRLIQDRDERQVTCFDLAHDVAFELPDFYDYLHNTPAGATKIGGYLASRLLTVEAPDRKAR